MPYACSSNGGVCELQGGVVVLDASSCPEDMTASVTFGLRRKLGTVERLPSRQDIFRIFIDVPTFGFQKIEEVLNNAELCVLALHISSIRALSPHTRGEHD